MKTKRFLGRLFAIAALSTGAFAQESTYNYGYYTNANTAGFPDARMSVINPGSKGGFSPVGDLCANIYVFLPDTQMIECCSCKVSPNGLRTFSLNTDLTSNPFTSFTPHSGAIKIVSSAVLANGLCETSTVTPFQKVMFPVAGTNYTPASSLGA
jgi:hypothetical protein